MKMKARTVVGRGKGGPLCDPGSELLPGRESERSARIINGMKKKKKEKKNEARQIRRNKIKEEQAQQMDSRVYICAHISLLCRQLRCVGCCFFFFMENLITGLRFFSGTTHNIPRLSLENNDYEREEISRHCYLWAYRRDRIKSRRGQQ